MSDTRKTGGTVGPIFGVLIIIALLLFGALYFWGAYQKAHETQQQLPLIVGDGTDTSSQGGGIQDEAPQTQLNVAASSTATTTADTPVQGQQKVQ